METQMLLLVIWVILGSLIFLIGVINAVSILTLETRMNNIDSSGSKTVWSFIKSNWDIFLAGLLLSIFAASYFFAGSRDWYKAHTAYTVIIAFLVIGAATGVILVKRLLMKK